MTQQIELDLVAHSEDECLVIGRDGLPIPYFRAEIALSWGDRRATRTVQGPDGQNLPVRALSSEQDPVIRLTKNLLKTISTYLYCRRRH
jgi:hypothetical protein